jgi:hypothetical protein
VHLGDHLIVAETDQTFRPHIRCDVLGADEAHWRMVVAMTALDLRDARPRSRGSFARRHVPPIALPELLVGLAFVFGRHLSVAAPL